MRKLFTLLSMFMLCLGMGAQTKTSLIEAYKVYMPEQTVQAGSTAKLYMYMNNRNPISRWECTLVLPDVVSYVDAELYTEEGCYPDGYNAQFTKSVNEDGSIHFLCEGEDGFALVTPSTSGNPVAVVTVNIPRDVAPNRYEVKTKAIKLQEANDGEIRNYTNNNGEVISYLVIEECPVTYGTITFNLNGAPLEYSPITVPVGDAIGTPDDPEWEGHTFLGWEPEIPDTMPDGGINVEAQWEVLKYNINVTSEGVTVSDSNPEWGTNVTVTVGSLTDMEFVSLFVTPEASPEEIDVTNSMEGNTYVIENVKCNYNVRAVYRSTKQSIEIKQDYTPFSCAYDLDFTGSDLKAYIASGFNKATNQAILVNITDVPAFTGVLLIGQAGEYSIPKSQSSNYYVNLFKPFIEGGWLNPADETADAVPLINYVFAEVNGEPGFYSLESEEGTIPGATANGISLPANSAYLQLPRSFAVSAAKVGFIFEDDVIDGITDIEATDSQAIFDLQGRRVNKAVKGIYIVNGKKIAVK